MLSFFKRNKKLRTTNYQEVYELQAQLDKDEKNLRHLKSVEGLRRVAFADEATLDLSHTLFTQSLHPGPEHDGRLREGFFHKWVEENRFRSGEGVANIWALIEMENGEMLTAHYLYIKFLE